VTLFELFNLGSPDKSEWMLDALCAETDPEVFYPEAGDNGAAAKRVCAFCAVREACLEDALTRRDFYGVRGGKSALQRRMIARQRTESARQAVA
jgi:WhiB family redox-sensing transcriptional regulator